MKSKVYYLNEKKNLARFYPTKFGWKKKLRSINYFHAPVYLSQALCFSGCVNLEKFLHAMHYTLQDFDFLFSRLYRRDEDLFLSYSSEDEINTFIQLEIEHKQQSSNSSSLPSMLPKNVDEKIRGVVTDQFDSLPMVMFKLTIFVDGFTIGCYWSHSLLDQSSMVYFFKYFSHFVFFKNRRH